MSAKWKGLDVNVHFQGSGKSTFFIDGTTVQMFSGGDGWGNVLKEMANGNRWILGVNEDPNAEFPRLTYGQNPNNYQKSDYCHAFQPHAGYHGRGFLAVSGGEA